MFFAGQKNCQIVTAAVSGVMHLGEVVIEFSNRDTLRAINKGDVDLLESYFLSGLSIDNKTEKEQWNLLHQATVLIGKVANPNSVNWLLSKGVDVNAIDTYGNTSTHYAVRNGDIATVKSLIGHGANLDVLNTEGINPLHQVLLTVPINEELLTCLLESGAPISTAASSFSNALGNTSLTSILSKHTSNA